MAEEFLPLLGVNPDGDDNPSDSDHGEGDDSDPDDVILGEEEGEEEPAEMEEILMDENFWEPRDDDDDSDDVERGSDEESIPISNFTFDLSLPAEHSYLGSDLEEVSGRTVHEDDTYLTLPIISLPGVILIPGQTLPLHLFQPMTVAMIRNVVRDDKTFGIVTIKYGQEGGASLSKIGTTAEIFSVKEENDERSGIMTVRVKATGRQRFHIKDTRRSNGCVYANVRIVPERILPDPLIGAIPASHQRFITDPVDISLPPVAPKKKWKRSRSSSSSSSGGGDAAAALLQQFFISIKKRPINRLSSANLTWWPPWVYNQYDVHRLKKEVKDELRSWNETLNPEKMPQDAVELSFWVAANLPLDDSLKLRLLGIDNAIQRLRVELSIIRKSTVMCCKDCGVLIANKKDIFTMSQEGPLGAYVNPGGHVHETLTVYKAEGLSLIGHPSTQNSWFPGYAWTIVQCRQCASHMGWKFTSVKRKLQPSKFWGLCRSSLVPGLQSDEEEPLDSGDRWEPFM